MALTSEALARRVQILICDVDGVMTDGCMYYGPEGEALKRFHTRDAHGLELLRAAGVEVAWVTRERSAPTRRRAEVLEIAEFREGATDKLSVVSELLRSKEIAAEEACYVGDDLGDLAPMKMVGLAIAVADAVSEVREVADDVTDARGGNGAVREVCDFLLRAQQFGLPALFEQSATAES